MVIIMYEYHKRGKDCFYHIAVNLYATIDVFEDKFLNVGYIIALSTYLKQILNDNSVQY